MDQAELEAFSRQLLKQAEANKRILDRLAGEQSLYGFIKTMWPILDPAEPFVDGWVLGAICEHLEAVTAGQSRRLLINVPPGTTKSMSTCVYWPSWEWGPMSLPSTRYMTFSYSAGLTERDSGRARMLMESREFQALWSDRFKITNDAVGMIQNDHMGWRMASSVGGKTTGYRANRLIVDDPHNVLAGESERQRSEQVRWFREALPTRMNNAERDAIIVIMQRVHESDVSGEILAKALDYDFLMIPMEYEPNRHFINRLGWQDPRGLDDETGEPLFGEALAEREGELCWPERFSPTTVAELKSGMTPYSVAGQLQQRPELRGNAIIDRAWWCDWPPVPMQEQLEIALAERGDERIVRPDFPRLEYVVAGLDTAFKEKESNDFSALTVWGAWRGGGTREQERRFAPGLVQQADGTLRMPDDEHMKIILMYAWQRRVPMHGPPEERPDGLSDAQWKSPQWIEKRKRTWGLVEWTAHLCRQFHVSTLLIEDKARGWDVKNELMRLYANEDFGIQMVDPNRSDKVQRAHALAHLWSNGVIYAPVVYQNEAWGYPVWAEAAINQFAMFPRGAHDDMVDASLYAIKHLRDTGYALRMNESEERYEEDALRAIGQKRLLPYQT